MDVGSKNAYPASALSNFSPHPFEIDGVKCNSMEGFLQSTFRKYINKKYIYGKYLLLLCIFRYKKTRKL